MSPIEVAIDEMSCRVKELNDAILATPTDVIKLQLKLQVRLSWIFIFLTIFLIKILFSSFPSLV